MIIWYHMVIRKFSFLNLQRSFLVETKKKNEKTSPSWGGQGGGLPLLEPGQLGPALNNYSCCKIEEIIYETRVQYSRRNLPQTPHDEAWKEGMWCAQRYSQIIYPHVWDQVSLNCHKYREVIGEIEPLEIIVGCCDTVSHARCISLWVYVHVY